MNKLKTAFLAAFILMFLNSARAESPLLTSQIPSGFSQPFTRLANDKVERIFLTTYQNTYKRLKLDGDHYQASLLLNAPISGQTNRRGRHLLSFSAFSGFLKLAKWGLDTGANINMGDKDNATMLRMAIANKLEYIVEFALRHGANPNLLQGMALNNTMGDMKNFGWPIAGFELAWKHGAKLRTPMQRQKIENYLIKITSDDPEAQNRLNYFLNLLNDPTALISSAIPDENSITAGLIPTYMIGKMDGALLNEIKRQRFTKTHIEQFNVNGMYLPHYLTFNGMEKSLEHILNSLPPAEAEAWVTKRDYTGNDLITSAIKSLNSKLLKMILTFSKKSLNEPVPDIDGFYSRGDTPLHIALKWHAPDELFDVLFDSGAEKSLEIENSRELTPEQMLDAWYLNSHEYPRLKSILKRD
ncbi:hypothetical protein [Endozoicomonas sp. OPT23]|uniref:hypothetical protein n=1 Tax=Endozoicomonas sp. OPT23 TaxID=2072845 RepID=UPI00129AFD68|nr:hypothetical protein [Endozoicomonas sp. OPT23]